MISMILHIIKNDVKMTKFSVKIANFLFFVLNLVNFNKKDTFFCKKR